MLTLANGPACGCDDDDVSGATTINREFDFDLFQTEDVEEIGDWIRNPNPHSTWAPSFPAQLSYHGDTLDDVGPNGGYVVSATFNAEWNGGATPEFAAVSVLDNGAPVWTNTLDDLTGVTWGTQVTVAGFLPIGDDIVEYKEPTIKVSYYDEDSMGAPIDRGSQTQPIDSEFVNVENRTDSVFGNGWTHDQYQFLVEQGNTQIWSRGENLTATFQGGEAPEVPGSLIYNPNDWYEYDDGFGSELVFTPVVVDAGLSDSRYMLTSRTDPNQNQTTYTYIDANSDGVYAELELISDPFGRTTTFAYGEDDAGDPIRLLSITDDVSGRQTSFTYNTDGFLESITEPAIFDEFGSSVNTTTQFQPNATGRIQTVTNPRSNTAEFIYEFHGRWTSYRDFDGSVHKRNFAMTDALGNALTASPASVAENTNQRGHTETRKFNRWGNEIERIDALGNSFVTNRDGNGLVTGYESTVEVDGSLEVVETTIERDATGFVVTGVEFFDNGPSVSYSDFTNSSLPETFTDELGREIRVDYDGDSEMMLSYTTVMGEFDGTTVVDDLRYTYTYVDPATHGNVPFGLIESITDPNGNVAEYEYYEDANDLESFGRLKSLTFVGVNEPDRIIQYSYDITVGNTEVTVTDELGRIWKYHFNAANQLSLIEEPDPDAIIGSTPTTQTHTYYDGRGNVTLVIDAEGNKTAYEYDGNDRLTRVIEEKPDATASSPETTLIYDPEGNLQSVKDAEGRVTVYHYDPLNRVVAEILPDVDGNPSSVHQNPASPKDVNADGIVDNADRTLLDDAITNNHGLPQLNSHGLPTKLLSHAGLPSVELLTYLDVDGNGSLQQNDLTAWGDGLVLSVPDYADLSGHPVSLMEYDPVGNLIKRTDPNENTTEFRYDERSQRTQVIRPQVKHGLNGAYDNPTTTYVYDAARQLTSITNANGGVTELFYDDAGRLVYEIGPDVDGVASSGWQNKFAQFDVTNDGVVDLLDVDEVNNWLTDPNYPPQTDPPSYPGTPDGIVLPAWSSGDPFIDVNGDGLLSTKDENIVQNFISTGQVDASLFDDRPVIRHVYDDGGRLTFTIDPMFALTEYRYDEFDRLVAVIGEHETGPKSSIHDPIQSIATIRTAASRPVTEFQYDASIRMTGVVDPLGRLTTFDLDPLDRIERITEPDPDISVAGDEIHTEYDHDLLGNVTSMIDPRGNPTTYAYDDLYRLTLVTSPTVEFETFVPGGSSTVDNVTPIGEYKYNAVGELIEYISPELEHTAFFYDDIGRLSKRVMPMPDSGQVDLVNSPFDVFEYDLAGNRTSRTDALGQERSWSFDSLHRVVSLFDENGDETKLGYDYAGNTIALEDAESNVTTWTMDGLHRADSETNELSDSRTYAFDLVGNLVEKVDRLGRHTQYTLDNLYRMTNEIWYDQDPNSGGGAPPAAPDHEISFNYDLAARLLDSTGREGDASNDPYFEYTYGFDDVDRVVSQTLQLDNSHDVVLGYEYDRNGNRKELNAQNGTTYDFVTTYGYDALNRMTSITQDKAVVGNQVAGKHVELRYDQAGRMNLVRRFAGTSASQPSVAVSAFDYDMTGRLIELGHYGGAATPSDEIARYEWTFTQDNRIETFHSHNDALVTYDYDLAGQITEAVYNTGNQPDEFYEYDANGNRETVLYDDPNPVDPIEFTAHWMADDSSGTTAEDEEVGHDATFAGNPSWLIGSQNIAPIEGNVSAIDLDGAGDYLVANDPASLRMGNDNFSLALWVKIDPSDQSDMMIVSHGNPQTAGGKGFELNYGGDYITRPLRFFINKGGGFPPSQAQSITYNTEGNLADNEWHHIGVTVRQNGQITMYLDGVAVRAVKNSKSGNIQPTGDFLIGARSASGGSTHRFVGAVDDIRVFHSELTAVHMSSLALGRQLEESYTYTTGTNNQLLNDGQYSYAYNEEGNRTERRLLHGYSVDKYNWDHRNRLVSVDQYESIASFQIGFESDDGGFAVDSIGNALPGTFEGDALLATVNSPQANSTKAIDLDGNGDYITMGIQEVFAPQTSGFTLMMWAKADNTAPFMGLAAFGDGLSGSGVGYALYYISSSQQLVFSLSDGQGSLQSVSHNVGDLDDDWHHVAVTIDPATSLIELYFDDVSVAQTTLTESLGPLADVSNYGDSFTIGALVGGSAYEFDGQLDDVRLATTAYDASRVDEASDDEVIRLFHRGRVEYRYDHQNRLIARGEDPDGGNGNEQLTTEYFVHDGIGQQTNSANLEVDNLQQVGQIVLRLDENFEVTHRYLWGPQTDQLLADEQVDVGVLDVLWALTDHLGSVRDLVRYDTGTGTVEEVVHRSYDSFGQITGETNPESVDVLFGYSGRPYDDTTELQNNLNRWYDAKVGRWTGEDPISFAGGDANLYRYVGNKATTHIDPTGTIEMYMGNKWDKISPPKPKPPGRYPNKPKGICENIWEFHSPFGESKEEILSDVETITPEQISDDDYDKNGNNSGHQITSTSDMDDNDLVGSNGAGPCIGVIACKVEDEKTVEITVCHFGCTEDPSSTLSTLDIDDDDKTIVFGGNDDPMSNQQLSETIDYLQGTGASVTYSNTTGLYVDREGRPVGSHINLHEPDEPVRPKRP